MKKYFKIRVLSLVFLVFLVGISFSIEKNDYSIILKRNIFTAPIPPPPPPKIQQPTSILKPTPLPPLESIIELKGIVHFPQGISYAILKTRNQNEESICKEGEVIEKAKIIKIDKESVTFEYDEKNVVMNLENKRLEKDYVSINNDIKVAVESEEAKNISDVLSNKVPKALDPITLNFSETINQLKENKDLTKNLNISPFVKDGKVEGFEINRLPTNSLPYQYGLRNGDIIQKVNGIPIDSLSKGFSVYNQIVQSGTKLITVEVLRNGEPIILTYQLQ